MPRFLVNVVRPMDFDHAAMIDASAMADIDALNDAMVEAGVRLFVGGLHAAEQTRWIGADCQSGSTSVDGLWVIECSDMAGAAEWGERAAAACRATIEIRQFH